MSYNQRHGGAYDREAADSYYGRPMEPHYYKGATYQSEKVEMKDMLGGEIVAYKAGYQWNEENGDKKDWG
jgi:hypothetical protein